MVQGRIKAKNGEIAMKMAKKKAGNKFTVSKVNWVSSVPEVKGMRTYQVIWKKRM